jgi:hypothetical protein
LIVVRGGRPQQSPSPSGGSPNIVGTDELGPDANTGPTLGVAVGAEVGGGFAVGPVAGGGAPSVVGVAAVVGLAVAFVVGLAAVSALGMAIPVGLTVAGTDVGLRPGTPVAPAT